MGRAAKSCTFVLDHVTIGTDKQAARRNGPSETDRQTEPQSCR